MVDQDDVEEQLVLEGTVEDTIPPTPPMPSLFALVTTARPTIDWTEEQRAALDEIDEWRKSDAPFFSLSGPAGSGKSTLVSEVSARMSYARLTAMTGKAALRLTEVAGAQATTLHKSLYFPPEPGHDVRFTRLRDPESFFYIVDEVSMTSPSVFLDMQRWAKHGVRFLLVGDSYQLPPVITGEEERKYGSDWSIFSVVPGASLRTVMRNSGGVLQAATRVRSTAEICRESIPDEQGGYEYIEERNPSERAVSEYLRDPESHLLITWRNATRMAANRAIRERLGHTGPLPDVGEPVLIKKNGQGYMNGEILGAGEFETGPELGGLRTLWMNSASGRLLVSFDGGPRDKGGEFFDGGVPWVENFKQYHAQLKREMLPEPLPLTWGYCLTAHSAQGSQARRATVFLDRGDVRSQYFNKSTTLPGGEQVPFSARFIYTATTRATKKTMMVVGR